MSEIIENGIQLLMTGICTVFAACFALRSERREWVLLSLFSASFFLGDLYWLLFLVFLGDTPNNSIIPDMSWYASLLFLYLLLRHAGEGKQSGRSKALWAVPVFTASMCIFYMQYGGYVSNLIYAVLFSLILWRALSGLTAVRAEQEGKSDSALYRTAVFFCAVMYTMWTLSCFFEGNTFANPYFWFDTMLSLTFLLFIPAVRKAVEG